MTAMHPKRLALLPAEAGCETC